MRKIVGILFLILVTISTLSFAAYSEEAGAPETNDGLIELISEEPIVEESEIIYDDAFCFEEEVLINKTIDGNVYAMGTKVQIDGATIFGNVYVIAEELEIVNSRISGSVYAIGSSIKFSSIANDVYAIGESLDFDENANILRNANIAAENLEFAGKSNRNINAIVTTLEIEENAQIQGKLRYLSENEGTISENASFGEVEFEKQETEVVEEKEKINIGEYIFDAIGVVTKTLVISIIVVLLVKKFYILPRTEKYGSDLLKSMGKGAGALIIIPILSVMLMVTVIGVGFGLSLIAIYAIFLWIALPVISTEIAYRILKKKQPEGIKKSVLIGVAVLVSCVIWAIAEFVPVIGGLLNFVLFLMGLGVLFDLIFAKIKKEEELNEN